MAHDADDTGWRMQALRDRLRKQARALKAETVALYLVARDPRVPWYARLLVAGIVAYALSPIDLIPDFVPVLGYLDDLILVPLGLALALRMVPPDVMADCRARAAEIASRPTSRGGLIAIVGIWALAIALVIWLTVRAFTR